MLIHQRNHLFRNFHSSTVAMGTAEAAATHKDFCTPHCDELSERGATAIMRRKTATHRHFGFRDALNFILDFVISIVDYVARVVRVCHSDVSSGPVHDHHPSILYTVCTDLSKCISSTMDWMAINWLIATDFPWSNRIRKKIRYTLVQSAFVFFHSQIILEIQNFCCVFIDQPSFVWLIRKLVIYFNIFIFIHCCL